MTSLGLKEAKELVEGAPVSSNLVVCLLVLFDQTGVVTTWDPHLEGKQEKNTTTYARPANRGSSIYIPYTPTNPGPFIPSNINHKKTSSLAFWTKVASSPSILY